MNESRPVEMVGGWVGFAAALTGLLGALWLLIYWVLPYYSISPSGVRLVGDPGNLGRENAPIIAFWATVLVVIALAAAFVVRRRVLWALWVLAVALLVFTFLSLFSIGAFVAPFALLTLLSATLLTLGRWTGRGRKPGAV